MTAFSLSGHNRRVLASFLLWAGVAVADVAPPEPAPSPGIEATTPPASSPPASTTGSLPPSAQPTWPDLFARTSSGVARIAATACDGGWSGSGFLLDASTVLTAAHVVVGSTSLAFRFREGVYAGQPVLLDLDNDLAVVRLDGEAVGHTFGLADTSAKVGDEVAVLGHPRGQPIAMTRGAVTAVDLRLAVDGKDRFGLLRTDAAINPGNSGGPVIDASGNVLGVVTAGGFGAGEGWATSQPAIAEVVASAGATADPVALTTCPTHDEVDTVGVPVSVTISSPAPDAPSITQLLQLYAQSINDRHVDLLAWHLLTPRMRERVGSPEELAERLSTTSWLSIDVLDVEVVDAVTDRVDVSARSVQSAEHGPDGATCADWRITFTLTLDEGYWQIDGEELTDEQPPIACEDPAALQPELASLPPAGTG